MNTNNLKRFAQETRRKLLEQVGSRLSFVLNADTILLREKTDQIKQLREELNRTQKELLIEKVAYTWFNRLMALRFMDANDYQPLGIRILSPKDGYTIPELLDEAKRGNIPDELKVNRKRVFDLLDNRIPSSNPQNEAYKELLIAACNHLNSLLPFLFERINDYTELLIPDDLTSDFSIVTDIRNGILTEDCNNVEIIGWLYQFYVSEKKDEVFAAKSVVNKEDIPAATQLFTPRWIVEYMVQNTLGKLWIRNRPESRLREFMPYFIESESLTSADYLKVGSPEEIKMADPASGSGHILVYSFELFTKIYEEEGYSPMDIPRLIIEKNLYGFEIDERAAQLSGLALMMKARVYHRSALKMEMQPNIVCFNDLTINDNELESTLSSLNCKIPVTLFSDLQIMQQATNFGSLIVPETKTGELQNIVVALNLSYAKADMFQKTLLEAITNSVNQLLAVSQKFHCVVANPPYMGSGNMNGQLSQFVKTYYPDSKADLMACFMESGLLLALPKGYLGMINQQTWMFIGSYERLRKKLINDIFFDTLLHLGARTFPEIGGEVVQNATFTIWKNPLNNDGKYFRLVDDENTDQKRLKTLQAIHEPESDWIYSINQNKFCQAPDTIICYWLSEFAISQFESKPSLASIYPVRVGLSTSDSPRFLRLWFEVSLNEIGFNSGNIQEAKASKRKWFPFNKGGFYRKWYGNNDFILNYYNDGEELKHWLINNPNDPTTTSFSRYIRSPKFYFKQSLTWTKISSGNFSIRFTNQGFIFSDASNGIFPDSESDICELLGLLNSKVAKEYLTALSPTLNFKSGDIGKIPIVYSNDIELHELVNECVNIAKRDWDFRETSWDFTKNELLTSKAQDIEEAFDIYTQFWKNKFVRLCENEQEINRRFINLYELQNELSPKVKYEDITILREETAIKNGQLIFNSLEILKQLMSYAVGCMFGRYSIEKDGLILANQGESLQDYLRIIGKDQSRCIFLPDNDNIIPILDDDWFEDDINNRFNEFLKASFGEKNYNSNLSFIEEQLGKDIRKYFMRDFFPDHVKRYKKRPIYWMFSSANGSFNVLIYMHRYTSDTVNNILNKYLREFINKLKTRKEHLIHVSEVGSPAEKIKAIKEMDNNEKILIELKDYERDILYPLAIERIPIDLDDGVLVNYNKFGKAVKEIAGLNDKKTKEAVRKFDWIDTSQIR